jgi:hypothetical protein
VITTLLLFVPKSEQPTLMGPSERSVVAGLHPITGRKERSCKHCAGPLTLFQRITKAEFCCSKHGELHRQNRSRQIASLLEAVYVTPRLYERALIPKPTMAAPPVMPGLWSGSGQWEQRPLILQVAQTEASEHRWLLSTFGAESLVTPTDTKTERCEFDVQPVMSRPATLDESLSIVFPTPIPDDPAPLGCEIKMFPQHRESGACGGELRRTA